MVNAFIVLQMNTLEQEKNAFCAIAQNAFFLLYYSDDRFSANLLLTGTHLRKWAVVSLSYSLASTLYPQVIYAIVFSAGLSGLEVD